MKTLIESYQELDRASVRRFLPVRGRETHKGDYGKVLLLCGSVGYTGAARLAAMAACRSGAGLCYLGVPASVYPIVASGLLEPVVFPLPSDESGCVAPGAAAEVLPRLSGVQAVLAGPGLGRGEGVLSLISMLLSRCTVPLLLDADGINVLQGHMNLLRNKTCPVILTPHDGEFCRLYAGKPAGRYLETRTLSRETGCIVLRKGYRTLISDGETTYRNRTGNPGMARGGSGDVLSGIILALLGQGVPPLEAAALGAWIHGAAGDLCAGTLGEYGMLPTDLIGVIPQILK